MKKNQNNQPPEFVRKSNEEILEAMKQALLTKKDDTGVYEILLKLVTFTPEKGAVDKAVAEIVALSYEKHLTRKLGF